jgi:hypothetical protein
MVKTIKLLSLGMRHVTPCSLYGTLRTEAVGSSEMLETFSQQHGEIFQKIIIFTPKLCPSNWAEKPSCTPTQYHSVFLFDVVDFRRGFGIVIGFTGHSYSS